MHDYDKQIPIALLVDQDCLRAQEPYVSQRGNVEDPYAVRNALEWFVMGPVLQKTGIVQGCKKNRDHYTFQEISRNFNSIIYIFTIRKIE